MKILNLYAGIGGNRKLWGNEDEITAVELDPKIASIYQDFFPNDKMVITDAHQYLLEHFKEFDFIWSSPPCPSHSAFRKNFSCNNGSKPIYPDMKLYEEILLLDNYFNGKYCIENVISYYPPLIVPTTIQRHYFWTNFNIASFDMPHIAKDKIIATGKYSGVNEAEAIKRLSKRYNFNIDKYQGINKRRTLKNCVFPELGLHIFNEMKNSNKDLFSN